MKNFTSLLYIAITAFITLGPLPRQVLHIRSWPIPGWIMFSGRSLDVCVGRFTSDDGKESVNVRAAKVARQKKNISPRQLESFVADYCENNSGTRLRAELKCADRHDGWDILLTQKQTLCSPAGRDMLQKNLAGRSAKRSRK